MKIGVIGHKGMVGGTVYRWFILQGYNVTGYSLNNKLYEKETNESDVIFVCVPTPYHWDDRGFDDSIVDEVLAKIQPEKIVVIKSTVWLGTTDKFQAKYPQLKILFNPEFLSEATCDADFDHPDRQFIGYTKQSYSMALKILDILPESAYSAIMPAKEAELLKYINNLHGALQVMEANHFYEVCKNEGLDYERVIKAAEASKWVGAPMGRTYHKIFHKGFRGFGGACFPKDINSWLQYCEKTGIDTTFIKAARDMNKRILSEQNLTEEQAEKYKEVIKE